VHTYSCFSLIGHRQYSVAPWADHQLLAFWVSDHRELYNYDCCLASTSYKQAICYNYIWNFGNQTAQELHVSDTSEGMKNIFGFVPAWVQLHTAVMDGWTRYSCNILHERFQTAIIIGSTLLRLTHMALLDSTDSQLYSNVIPVRTLTSIHADTPAREGNCNFLLLKRWTYGMG